MTDEKFIEFKEKCDALYKEALKKDDELTNRILLTGYSGMDGFTFEYKAITDWFFREMDKLKKEYGYVKGEKHGKG